MSQGAAPFFFPMKHGFPRLRLRRPTGLFASTGTMEDLPPVMVESDLRVAGKVKKWLILSGSVGGVDPVIYIHGNQGL